ncbi:TPA: hypothetical protein ACTXXA_003185 [Legionella anisa]
MGIWHRRRWKPLQPHSALQNLCRAISKTALNGEINCLDPGGFGAVTITKSITIDCHEVFASILNASSNGININFSSFAGTDTRKTVRLRNLNFNGADTGLVGVNITTSSSANTKVFIEDCLIDGNFAGNARGIFDQRTGTNAQLSISNTTIRNMGSSGVSVIGSANSKVSINNSKIANCVLGIAAVGGPKVSILTRYLLRTPRVFKLSRVALKLMWISASSLVMAPGL